MLRIALNATMIFLAQHHVNSVSQQGVEYVWDPCETIQLHIAQQAIGYAILERQDDKVAWLLPTCNLLKLIETRVMYLTHGY